ncbi:lytic transglycosylase domain-containing protein [Mesorhizobium sp. VK22B]|uniref:Lytic transglycosylase domain-containing protein n=1 Tax=Mesorhizobium captivum TaxID=3072319 RepID=A0ABU4Z0D9_9HYPH|nr:lytic transglycosylase domain-containing protein [Mesorhizobium sp. VK22E]MDX8492528.1 lytic transglycosylase domain-containing protein [Mesorhizobium sp. VK22B]MDX8505617.1 lytic transglycosylase domain-containing protein [Mesorhizobium sp. VK22E]
MTRRIALLLVSGLAIASPALSVDVVQAGSIARPSARDAYAGFIAEAAMRFRLPAAWICAILQAESAGDPRATSRKGATGLMQVMPDTWADLSIRYRLGRDPYDPHDNIIAGAAYIRELLDRFGSPGWIAGYNTGPGSYEASLSGSPLPQETRAYLAVVLSEIGASATASPPTLASADPLAWTRAPLFIAQPDRRSTANLLLPERPRDDAPNSAFARDVSAIEPQSRSLFVALTKERNAP